MTGAAAIRSEPGVVWRIVLDRPEARNAVTEAMLGELSSALADAAADALASDDLAEGVRARRERRPPRFRGA
jgi:enoyl-CoA hydratase/carnithine racemase